MAHPGPQSLAFGQSHEVFVAAVAALGGSVERGDLTVDPEHGLAGSLCASSAGHGPDAVVIALRAGAPIHVA